MSCVTSLWRVSWEGMVRVDTKTNHLCNKFPLWGRYYKWINKRQILFPSLLDYQTLSLICVTTVDGNMTLLWFNGDEDKVICCARIVSRLLNSNFVLRFPVFISFGGQPWWWWQDMRNGTDCCGFVEYSWRPPRQLWCGWGRKESKYVVGRWRYNW